MAIERILISSSPGEIRIAEVSKGRLKGFTVHRNGFNSRVGYIYLGRVEAVIQNLQAAFVDIGEGQPAFLAVAEMRPQGNRNSEDQISDYLAEGDSVLVQVMRDAENDKGAKLTTQIGLLGRDLVYLPCAEGVSVSRRILLAADRDRLKAVVMGFVMDNKVGGYIVRTAAQEANNEDIISEAARLRTLWLDIEVKRQQSSAPAMIHANLEPALAILRDRGSTELGAIVVDDVKLFHRINAFIQSDMPDLDGLLSQHLGTKSLFVSEGVDDMVDAVLNLRVTLPLGGDIQIVETPALTAIDVNTGSADFGERERSAFEVNKAAANEIAHQIQLRNLSGLIIVDFVSMRRRDAQSRLGEIFRSALAADPLQPQLIGFTRLGLAEVTRRREGGSLQRIICGMPEEPISSPETTALAALRGVLIDSATSRRAVYGLRVHPAVASCLINEVESAFEETKTLLGGQLELTSDAAVERDNFYVEIIR